MEIIDGYIIITHDVIGKFNQRVRDAIKDGYQPIGPATVLINPVKELQYFQTLFSYKPTKKRSSKKLK